MTHQGKKLFEPRYLKCPKSGIHDTRGFEIRQTLENVLLYKHHKVVMT